MKSFIAKRVTISILVNLRYLRFKLLKYKENNKKICHTFDYNFKNIPLYIIRKVSLEKYYFVLYDGALTLKMSKQKWCLTRFAIKLFICRWQQKVSKKYPSSTSPPFTYQKKKKIGVQIIMLLTVDAWFCQLINFPIYFFCDDTAISFYRLYTKRGDAEGM